MKKRIFLYVEREEHKRLTYCGHFVSEYPEMTALGEFILCKEDTRKVLGMAEDAEIIGVVLSRSPFLSSTLVKFSEFSVIKSKFYETRSSYAAGALEHVFKTTGFFCLYAAPIISQFDLELYLEGEW
jgi:hypothetical protein